MSGLWNSLIKSSWLFIPEFSLRAVSTLREAATFDESWPFHRGVPYGAPQPLFSKSKDIFVLYMVEIDVKIPDTIDGARLDHLKKREKEASGGYQSSGEWLHLWRVAGKFGNVSIFDVADHDRLNAILWSLPLFPFMTLRIVPLALHPSAVSRAAI